MDEYTCKELQNVELHAPQISEANVYRYGAANGPEDSEPTEITKTPHTVHLIPKDQEAATRGNA